jgi:hypothetical protein
MTVIGSRYGDNNLYQTGPGKGFTIICNDCGIVMTNECLDATYCVFCDLIPGISCPGCEQKVLLHNHTLCKSEVNYVQTHEESVEQVRSSEGGS